MTPSLKPYPAYKDSGVEWLGEVPEHWRLAPNRTLFKEIKDRGYPDELLLSVTIARGVIQQSDLLSDTSKKDSSNLDKSAYKLVQAGDIAYNKMRAWEGAIGFSQYRGIVSPAYIVQRPQNQMMGTFAHYLLRTPSFAKEAERWSYGISSDQWSLRPEHFKMIYCCVPPLPEQTAITHFLDYTDRRIQRYIHAKQKLITLLQEQKQAIIHQAVTRGLDPNVPTRATGIYWIPEIPAHWSFKRLKFLTNIPSGQVDPRLEEHRHKVLIAPNHITSGGGRIIAFETADAQGADSGKYEVRAGDVVYSKIRPNLRKAAISPVDGLCSADMYPIRVREDEIIPAFFLHLLLSNNVTNYAVDCSMRVAMPKVNREALGNSWLAYPTLPEQIAIVDRISSGTANLDVAIKRDQRKIDLLNEYRTRLISDVVTGKLDVREAAAKLPEVDPLETEADLETLEPTTELTDELEAIAEGASA